MRRTGQTSAVILIVSVLFLTILAGAAIPLFSGGQGGPQRDPEWTPPPRTVAPTRSASRTMQPLPGLSPVVAPTTTTAPTRTVTATSQTTAVPAFSTSTATSAPTLAAAAAVASAVTASPTPEPTPVLTLPPSATSTDTPEPTETPLPAPTPAIAAAPPTLTDPPNGASARGVITFRWEPNGPLPPGAGYEVVWWNPDEPPQAARGLAAPTQELWLEANIDVIFTSNQAPGGRVFWTVLVVSQNPYVRLTQPEASPQYMFIHQ